MLQSGSTDFAQMTQEAAARFWTQVSHALEECYNGSRSSVLLLVVRQLSNGVPMQGQFLQAWQSPKLLDLA